MKETEDLELQMFQNYFPAGIDQASTAVSEGAPDGSDRGQPTPRLGSGNKGQRVEKGRPRKRRMIPGPNGDLPREAGSNGTRRSSPRSGRVLIPLSQWQRRRMVVSG